MQNTLNQWMTRIGGKLLTAGLLGLAAVGSAAAQSWAYANVVGSTSNGAALIASDTGGVDVGFNGARPMLASAPGRTFTQPKQMERPTKEEYGLQNLYSKVTETSIASAANASLFKQIAEIYIAQQVKDPNLIIDVLTVPARGKNGVEKSKRVALNVAQQLRDNGVKNVRLDFNPDFPPTKQTRPAPKST